MYLILTLLEHHIVNMMYVRRTCFGTFSRGWLLCNGGRGCRCCRGNLLDSWFYSRGKATKFFKAFSLEPRKKDMCDVGSACEMAASRRPQGWKPRVAHENKCTRERAAMRQSRSLGYVWLNISSITISICLGFPYTFSSKERVPHIHQHRQGPPLSRCGNIG